jgi:NitT/TauT family transport system substrate-binding protein
MKKILALILVLTLTVFAFVSCGEEETDDVKLRVGFMGGPTGMGLAKLIADNGGLEGNEKYSFEKTTTVSQATAALTAGILDLVCVPTSDAAEYYAKDPDLTVLAINTLNTLFVLTDGESSVSTFDDLKGKTVYTCAQGTPKIILEYLIESYGLDTTVSTSYNGSEILTPAQLGEQIIAGNLPIAVVPEPIVTSSLLKIKSNNNPDISYTVDINLSDVWSVHHETPIAMGCILAKKSFVNEHKKAIDAFLNEYKASVEFINNSENIDTAATYVVDSGVMAAAPAAKKALTSLKGAIVYIDGEDMKKALLNFYEAINVTAPADESFYYEK